ncbi:MAG: hypothetical protein LUQ71_00025 [Methanoregula sp.]|nr:hypothetical protein [Methanoregula sp.]
MPEFFTVDRNNRLTEGIILNTDSNYINRKFWPIGDIISQSDLSQLVNEIYPEGLTEHGKNYLLDECLVIPTPNGPAPIVPHIPMIELVFELVRRIEFPDQISRYQAIFGWGTLEEAKKFNERDVKNNSPIYVVSCERSTKLDMNLLFLGGSSIGSILFA